MLAGASAGMDVDHINGDTLDNRKENLRVSTHAENCRNQKPRAAHGLKGVSFKPADSSGKPWAATLHLGHFSTKELAARAYDKAAVFFCGKFARLNYPIALGILMLGLTGCGILPKRVEFFQDKVQRFPVPASKQIELQREVARKANDKAAETLHQAIKENSSPTLLVPAAETEKLTAAVAESVGAPAKSPAKLETDALITDLRAQMAKLDNKVTEFVKDNNENAGKKIEGTGLVQVPYFAWTGGILVFLLVGWYILRTVAGAAALANPGAAVGVGAMNVAGSVVSKAFQQVVKGGEEFKDWVGKEINDPALKQKVLDAFTAAHKETQDQDVKSLVDHVIK
jgi:hypothetical protein